MAGTSSDSNDLQCPICQEEFHTPKLLPCAHTVCRRCLQSWIQKREGLAGCPLCRFPLAAPASQGQGRPVDQVDVWPTDLMTKDRVEIGTILKGPHTCQMCLHQKRATSFCFHCAVKLCEQCSQYHRKLPGTAQHALENVNRLTARQLIHHHRTSCRTHEGSTADLYCSRHDELICVACFHTRHRDCPVAQPIAEAAQEKRTQLAQDAQKLKETRAQMAEEIQAARTHFRDMREMAGRYFDDLETAVRNRRRKVDHMIHEAEDTAMAPEADLERLRAVMTSHVQVAVHAVTSSADDTLLQMQAAVTSRLSDLQGQAKARSLRPLMKLKFDHAPVAVVLPLGKMVTPTESTPGPSSSKRHAGPAACASAPKKRITTQVIPRDDSSGSSDLEELGVYW